MTGSGISSLLASVTPQVRRGLGRLYVISSSLWVAWFGYRIYTIVSSRHWRWSTIESDVLALLLVPVATPVAYALTVWVISGFLDHEPTGNYGDFLERAISRLPVSNTETRRQLYALTAAALHAHLDKQLPPLTQRRIACEQRAFNRALQQIERSEAAKDRDKRQAEKGSTTLLVASLMLCPVLWLGDATAMSVFWVVRPAYGRSAWGVARPMLSLGKYRPAVQTFCVLIAIMLLVSCAAQYFDLKHR